MDRPMPPLRMGAPIVRAGYAGDGPPAAAAILGPYKHWTATAWVVRVCYDKWASNVTRTKGHLLNSLRISRVQDTLPYFPVTLGV